jgi:hypothetical protein
VKDDLLVFEGYIYNPRLGFVKSVSIYKEWWDTRWGVWAYVDGDIADGLSDYYLDFIKEFKEVYGEQVVRDLIDIVSPDKLMRIEDVV